MIEWHQLRLKQSSRWFLMAEQWFLVAEQWFLLFWLLLWVTFPESIKRVLNCFDNANPHKNRFQSSFNAIHLYTRLVRTCYIFCSFEITEYTRYLYNRIGLQTINPSDNSLSAIFKTILWAVNCLGFWIWGVNHHATIP